MIRIVMKSVNHGQGGIEVVAAFTGKDADEKSSAYVLQRQKEADEVRARWVTLNKMMEEWRSRNPEPHKPKSEDEYGLEVMDDFREEHDFWTMRQHQEHLLLKRLLELLDYRGPETFYLAENEIQLNPET